MNKTLARKALDKKLSVLQRGEQLARPHRGWIKAIREALGMSTIQLAKRMGVSQPRITALESAELDDSLTLSSLKRAAEAMDCTLVYAIVPKTSLNDLVQKRALDKAKFLMRRLDHTMALEKQSLDDENIREEIENLAQDIIEKKSKLLWDDTTR